MSFRKKKSSKNDTTTPKGAEGTSPSPTEKGADDAREPEVRLSAAGYFSLLLSDTHRMT